MPNTILKPLISARWRAALLATASVGLAACVADPKPGSSSSVAESSSSVVVASSSSVQPMSSSSEASSAAPVSSSSVTVSSSSESQVLGDIVPRTSCPSAPPASKPVDLANVGPYDLEISKDEYVAMLEDKGTFDGSRGSLPWHMYTPDQALASPDDMYPLIVSLHGGYGREGEDHHILQDGAPYMLGSSNGLLTTENKSKYPTYIIFPHCRELPAREDPNNPGVMLPEERECPFYSNEWSSSGGAKFQVQSQPSQNGQTLIELIEHMVETYNVDPARIYVTGVSMGGGGTWELAQRRPDLVAAAIPLAGHTPADQYLNTFSTSLVPVWAHAGEKDNTNSYNDTVQAVSKIDGDGGCAWVTGYDGYQRGDQYSMSAHGHSLWQRVYLNPDLWSWLFAQAQPRSNSVAASSSSSVGGASSSAPATGEGCDGALYCEDFSGGQLPNWLDFADCDGSGGSSYNINGGGLDITAESSCGGWAKLTPVDDMSSAYVKFDVTAQSTGGNHWFVLLGNGSATEMSVSAMRLRPQGGDGSLTWNVGNNSDTFTPDFYGPGGADSTAPFGEGNSACFEIFYDNSSESIRLWKDGVLLPGLDLSGSSASISSQERWYRDHNNSGGFTPNVKHMHLGAAQRGVKMRFDNVVISQSRIGCN